VDEAGWLNEQHNAHAMVWVLRGTKATRTKAGKRKLRLFSCACCRLTWDLLSDLLLRQVVEVAERFAEGEADKEELARAHEKARGALPPEKSDHRETTAAFLARHVAEPRAYAAAFYMTAYPVPRGGYSDWNKGFDAAICGLLRCVFGNPFRPSPPLPPAVLAFSDRLVPRLAQAIYADRLPDGTLDPGRLGVLHDGLLDAGCQDTALLEHLRSEGPHWRGCWAVDLLLGRA
jgi:hypothetical protein